jgi:hypothetical protein
VTANQTNISDVNSLVFSIQCRWNKNKWFY